MWLAAEAAGSSIKLATRRPPASLLGHGLACAVPLIAEAMKISGGAQPRELVDARNRRELFHAIPAPSPDLCLLADAYSAARVVAKSGTARGSAAGTAASIRRAMGDELKRKLSDCRADGITTISDDAVLLLGQLTCDSPPLGVERTEKLLHVPFKLPASDAARTLGVLLSRDWLHRATGADTGQPAKMSVRPVLGAVAAITWAVSTQIAAKWCPADTPGAPIVMGEIVAPSAVGDYDAAVLCSDGVARCAGPFQRTEFAGGSKRQRELHDIKLRLQTRERVAESRAVETYHASLLRALACCGPQALEALSARRERAPAAGWTELVPKPPCNAELVTVAALLLESSRSRERAAARNTASTSRVLAGVSSEHVAALQRPLGLAAKILDLLVCADDLAVVGAAGVGIAGAAPEPHAVLANALGKHAAAGTEAGRGLSERVQRAARTIEDGRGKAAIPTTSKSLLSATALAAAVDAARARAIRNRTSVARELTDALDLLAKLESGLAQVRRDAGNAAEQCRADVLSDPTGPTRHCTGGGAEHATGAALALLQHVAAAERVDMLHALARTMRLAARALVRKKVPHICVHARRTQRHR